MAPWSLASQSETNLGDSLEAELVSSLESVRESLLLVESLPNDLEVELVLQLELSAATSRFLSNLFFLTLCFKFQRRCTIVFLSFKCGEIYTSYKCTCPLF